MRALRDGGGSEYTASAAELEKTLCEGLPPVDPAEPVLGVEPAAAVPPPRPPLLRDGGGGEGRGNKK